MNGLRTIAGTSGAIHHIALPPERNDFVSVEAYERAYYEWWARMHFWKAERR